MIHLSNNLLLLEYFHVCHYYYITTFKRRYRSVWKSRQYLIHCTVSKRSSIIHLNGMVWVCRWLVKFRRKLGYVVTWSPSWGWPKMLTSLVLTFGKERWDMSELLFCCCCCCVGRIKIWSRYCVGKG